MQLRLDCCWCAEDPYRSDSDEELCDDIETEKELAAIDEVLKGIEEEDRYLNPPRELRPVEISLPDDYVKPHDQFIEPQQLQAELLAKVHATLPRCC